MHVSVMQYVVKPSGGDQACKPNLKSLARVEIRQIAEHVIFVECLVGTSTHLNTPMAGLMNIPSSIPR